MDIPEGAKRVRALLSKQGEADIQFELLRTSPVDFTILENGKSVGVYWRALSRPPTDAPGLRSEDTHLGISEALEGCLAKRYPGYTLKQVEYASD
jgi:hypothetical protein